MTTTSRHFLNLNWRGWLLVFALVTALGFGSFFGLRHLLDITERREALRAASGPFHDVEPRLLRLAERWPQDAEVARALALGYLQDQKYPAAESYFARWCSLRPGDAEPFRRRADMWKAWNHIAEAAEDTEHALQLEPNNLPLRRDWARWLFTMGRVDQAEAECRRCLESEPRHPAMLQLLVAVYQYQGRTSDATAAADRLVREHPRDADAHLLRGMQYLQSQEPAKAVECLRRAVALKGKHQQAALYQLSLALAQTGQAEESRKAQAQSRLLQEVDMYQELADRGQLEPQLRIAEQLLSAGQLTEAHGILARLAKQYPDSVAVHGLLASYHEQQGQPQLAAEHRARAAAGAKIRK
jgi:tetratricopeptide (TPR) repeat protein